VGDVAILEPGEVIPCDGVFLSGYNVKCDESGATGESDAIRKVSYDECRALRQRIHNDRERGKETDGIENHIDCFVLSGSTVLEGVGSYVVVAVGTKCFNGRIMMGSFLSGLDLAETLTNASLRQLCETRGRTPRYS